jgi:hypothetical protein
MDFRLQPAHCFQMLSGKSKASSSISSNVDLPFGYVGLSLARMIEKFLLLLLVLWMNLCHFSFLEDSLATMKVSHLFSSSSSGYQINGKISFSSMNMII